MLPGIDDDFPGDDLPSTPMPTNPYKTTKRSSNALASSMQVSPSDAAQRTSKTVRASECMDQSTGKLRIKKGTQGLVTTKTIG
jgi:hypothetical protein